VLHKEESLTTKNSRELKLHCDCSCLVKGLSTFITNLFTSEIKIKDLPKRSFMREYFHSFDNEVYPLILPQACHDMLFEEVSLPLPIMGHVAIVQHPYFSLASFPSLQFLPPWFSCC
jgi:hypothetical protein